MIVKLARDATVAKFCKDALRHILSTDRWQNFENMASPANLTTTARTASKFCARGQSQSRNIFDLGLIS